LISTADFKPGLTIELDGEVYQIMRVEHIKSGRGAAVVKTKLRHARTGALMERTFRSGERVERARVEHREALYLYTDGENYYFQDVESFDEIMLTANQIGESASWLKEGESITVLQFEGQLIGIELPQTVERRVVETDPGLRGDTASGGSKPAKVEGGITVQVPLFVGEGDVIKIDTRTGEYVERVN
jgi:elongation factor P